MDTWERLDRFLAIGSEDGAHRAGTIALTPGSARAVEEAVRADGERVVRRLVACGHGRAPVIFTLAAAAKTGDLATRRAAFAALPEVCATGAQLLAFAEIVQAFGGWGRATRTAVAHWYQAKTAQELVYQAMEHPSRGRWTHRDLLRLSHPAAPTDEHAEVYRWIARGDLGVTAPAGADALLGAIATMATGARTLLAVDVSGSMEWGQVAGVPELTPRRVAAAMAVAHGGCLAFAAGEHGPGGPWGGGDARLVEVPHDGDPDQMARAMAAIRFGGTDCALPMRWALAQGVAVDVFAVVTDSETWAGNQPARALAAYREATGIPAKLVVIGLLSDGFRIADPDDPGMLDVIGFALDTPEVIRDYSVRASAPAASSRSGASPTSSA